jgi:pimeloyl-ACP methyl ester carboxylesterase
MKYLALFGLLAITLACGGTTDQATPPSDEPAPLVAGPATVAASDGVSIAYTVSGQGSPALVFVHGWLCNQTFWSDQVEEFSQSNTVITIDLPGHGSSGMDRDGWPLMAYGADVQTVVEHFDLTEVVLIGHSMGGPIVLEAARLMPDRVAAVIGVDTFHNADAKYEPEQIEGYLAAYEQDFVATCQRFVTSMFREDSDPALVDRVVSDMCDAPPEVGISLLSQFFEYDMGPALAAVADIPVLYINADGFPTDSEVNQKYHPTFSGAVVQDVGHFLMMEEPYVFNNLLKQVVSSLED